MRRAAGSPSSTASGMQKKRHTTSLEPGARPAARSPSRIRESTCAVADSGRKFTNVPSATSPPRRSMRSRSAAT